jgi:hypothetical protein
METRLRYFSHVDSLKDFPSYAIDTEGNVWSFKYNKTKKLSPGFKRSKLNDKIDMYVRLTDRYGKIKNFSVNRLVALAFLPTDDPNGKVIHKNGNVNDNHLENLEWKDHRTQTKIDGYIIDEFIADHIKDVHAASIRKGLQVPDRNTFLNEIIKNALDEYIMRYGLRKVMQ